MAFASFRCSVSGRLETASMTSFSVWFIRDPHPYCYTAEAKPPLLAPGYLRVDDLPGAADLRPARVHRERLRADVSHVVPVVIALTCVAEQLVRVDLERGAASRLRLQL